MEQGASVIAPAVAGLSIPLPWIAGRLDLHPLHIDVRLLAGGAILATTALPILTWGLA